jgi:hypothetical protein
MLPEDNCPLAAARPSRGRHRRQLKVCEKGITGMKSKGKRILMLNLS